MFIIIRRSTLWCFESMKTVGIYVLNPKPYTLYPVVFREHEKLSESTCTGWMCIFGVTVEKLRSGRRGTTDQDPFTQNNQNHRREKSLLHSLQPSHYHLTIHAGPDRCLKTKSTVLFPYASHSHGQHHAHSPPLLSTSPSPSPSPPPSCSQPLWYATD